MPKATVWLEIPDHHTQIEQTFYPPTAYLEDLTTEVITWCVERGYSYDDISWDWEWEEEELTNTGVEQWEK